MTTDLLGALENEENGRRMNRLKYLDFFAGSGLVDIGLGDDWQCVWANDYDASKRSVYEANRDGSVFHFGDVADVSPSELPSAADMAWASFPCQDLSLAGWTRGMSANRSGTYWAFWRLMDALLDRSDRPPVLAIENVTGLLHRGNLEALCESLAALGMNYGALLMDAKYFVPQSRPRVFIVAVDDSVPLDGLGAEFAVESPWLPGQIKRAYRKLPGPLQERWRWWRLPEPTTPPSDIADLIDSSDEADWLPQEDVEYLLGLMNETHRAKVAAALSVQAPKVGFLYKRTRDGKQRAEVRFDGIAGCLRTPAGGSSRQTVIVAKDGRIRARLLSPREAARLMGINDELGYQLPKKYNDAYAAMGDAVVVPVVNWLGKHLLKPLAQRAAEVGAGARGLSASEEVRIAQHRETSATLATSWQKSNS